MQFLAFYPQFFLVSLVALLQWLSKAQNFYGYARCSLVSRVAFGLPHPSCELRILSFPRGDRKNLRSPVAFGLSYSPFSSEPTSRRTNRNRIRCGMLSKCVPLALYQRDNVHYVPKVVIRSRTECQSFESWNQILLRCTCVPKDFQGI